MPAELTEAEFSKHVNTKFRALIDPEPVELELVQVKGYAGRPEDHQGMERFSLFFAGPVQPSLPQTTYSLDHDSMGTFALFLVPIQPTAEASRYEAVFNYFKEG
ncbi:MAG TPA: hypothetical protein VNO50_15755 [Pyrinomonadaceae bacterium]|nr:hypothetical protein [Pyrinomonadaceae bacterium]